MSLLRSTTTGARVSPSPAFTARANPRTIVRMGPAIGGKPPAVPSAIPALDGFRWTAPEEGLAALMVERSAA